MRLAYKVWSGVAVGVFGLVAVGDLNGPTTTATDPAASQAGLATPAPAAPVAAAPAVPAVDPAVTGVSTLVTEVIDGDTFRTADGQTVRVLGIDSCEADTPGGRLATQAAEGYLLGAAVTLTAEPGVDTDRYDRELRYVTADGRDFAEQMVVANHTAIYTGGRNDASSAVQSTLAGMDADGRSCGTSDDEAVEDSSSGSTRTPTPDVDRPTRRPVADPAPVPARSSSGSSSGGSAYYKNCTAAHAAGAYDIPRGAPGYRAALDRNNDGVACES